MIRLPATQCKSVHEFEENIGWGTGAGKSVQHASSHFIRINPKAGLVRGQQGLAYSLPVQWTASALKLFNIWI
jgi:hypothetical protein